MEHKLLLGGGEQYLPFARSRVRALKALGMPYADQSFEVDGCSVKVRVEPGHEYIRIEGGARGFIEAVFLVGPDQPPTEEGLKAYAAAVAAASEKPEKPKLLKYSDKTHKWSVRSNTKLGVATGYSVVYTPGRIPAKPVGDKDYFDVVYKSGKKLMLSTPGGVVAILKDLPDTQPLPLLIPPVQGVSPDKSDATDPHVFFMSAQKAEHIASGTNTVDAFVDMQQALGSLPGNVQHMPPLATPVVSDSFGVVFESPTISSCNAFGTYANYNAFGFWNIFYWYAKVWLSSLPPYITLKASGVIARPYWEGPDIGEGGDRGTVVTAGGGSTAVPLIGSVVADTLTPVYEYVRTDVNGRDFYKFTHDVPGPDIYGEPLVVYGNYYVTHFDNFVTFEKDYEVCAQTGIAIIKHGVTIRVNYKFEDGTAITYAAAPGIMNDYGDYWPGIYDPTHDGIVPRLNMASGATITKTNSSSTTVDYAVEGDLLYSMRASLSYRTQFATVSTREYIKTARPPRSPGDEFPAPGDLPGHAPTPSATCLSWAFTANATKVELGTTATDTYILTSSVEVTTRDYIFHDRANSVAVYVESVGRGTRNAVMRDVSAGGGGTWKITAVVEAKGNKHEFVLSEFSNAGHRMDITEYEYIWEGTDQPSYIAPMANIAAYAPVCEQGSFPYIAYTTADEEARGVPVRFILALPLSLRRFVMPTIMFPAEEPPAPEGSYAFVMPNLTDAANSIYSDPFAELVGKKFDISVSHDGKRDWLSDVNGAPPAQCYRA